MSPPAALAGSLPLSSLALALLVPSFLLLLLLLPLLRTQLRNVLINRHLSHIPAVPPPSNASALHFLLRGHLSALEDFQDFAFTPLLLEYKRNRPAGHPLVIYRAFLGEPRLLLCTAEQVRHVAVARQRAWQKAPIVRDLLEDVLGKTSVVLAGDKDHTRLRATVHPAFHFDAVKACAPTAFVPEAARLAREIVAAGSAAAASSAGDAGAAAASGRGRARPVEVGPIAGVLAMRVVGIAGFGYRESDAEDREFLREYRAQLEFAPSQLFMLLKLSTPAWFYGNLVPVGATQARQCRVIRAGLRRMIRRRKAEIADAAVAGGSARLREDLLTVMLRGAAKGAGSGGETISEEEIVDQAQTFMTAGQITTASAIAYAAWQVTGNAGAQARLEAEVRPLAGEIVRAEAEEGALVGMHDEELTALMLRVDALPYLDAAVKETLRLFPPAPNSVRIALEEDTLDGVHIPQFANALVPLHMIQTDPETWGADAAEFNPDRWVAPHGSAVVSKACSMAYMPFLHGPRGCIGSRFALFEIKLAVAVMFGAFDVERPEDFKEPKIKGILPFPYELFLRFEPRPEVMGTTMESA
eukprot:CAMPEP_0174895924 /NCGR_PEP_ID=MMETSP0167-20121228/10212_1 /TAXON_ID=38298 /ORGANISM="Rhodella maculata, Strain CCMP736" /LENGTH=583 /DNA_ID=CAMNT_0016135351 /DNA_START=48 /DNA_END=1799 /DNA_ORIENTATION=+